jgi:hypothetical protein
MAALPGGWATRSGSRAQQRNTRNETTQGGWSLRRFMPESVAGGIRLRLVASGCLKEAIAMPSLAPGARAPHPAESSVRGPADRELGDRSRSRHHVALPVRCVADSGQVKSSSLTPRPFYGRRPSISVGTSQRGSRPTPPVRARRSISRSLASISSGRSTARGAIRSSSIVICWFLIGIRISASSSSSVTPRYHSYGYTLALLV